MFLFFNNLVQQSFYMNLIVSYLISFPLMMGEGWNGGNPHSPPPESHRGGRNYCLARGEKPSPSGEDFSMHTVCRFFRFPLVRISVRFVLS
jgi:hypothetical protein